MNREGLSSVVGPLVRRPCRDRLDLVFTAGLASYDARPAADEPVFKLGG